ncbi:hypothetical protein RCL1_002805 [Eukaryota sp. TZLM3-RCL]
MVKPVLSSDVLRSAKSLIKPVTFDSLSNADLTSPDTHFFSQTPQELLSLLDDGTLVVERLSTPVTTHSANESILEQLNASTLEKEDALRNLETCQIENSRLKSEMYRLDKQHHEAIQSLRDELLLQTEAVPKLYAEVDALREENKVMDEKIQDLTAQNKRLYAMVENLSREVELLKAR